MGSSTWVGSTWGAAVIVAVVALVLFSGFVMFWHKDKGRAEEVSADPRRLQDERGQQQGDPNDTSTGGAGSYAREGAANKPPESTRERRH